MKYIRNVRIRPIIAATIIFLADSSLALSPPDVIHLIPPYMRKKSAAITATINKIVMEFRTILFTLFKLKPQRLKNPLSSLGQGLIDAAKAGRAVVR